MKPSALLLAAFALVLAAPPAPGDETDDLAKKLKHFDVKERLRALDRLAEVGGERAAAAVAGAVADEDWEVQMRALKALGALKSQATAETVAKAVVEGEIILVRQAAADALRQMAVPEMYGRLLKSVARGRAETPKYLIEILNRAQIVCVLGKWDHSEIVLEHLKIKQTIIRPQEITEVGLNPKQLLLINCEGTIGKKEAIERLQWFVHVGGYLMATDWALTNAITRAFPGFVDMDSKSKTGNDVVEIEAVDPDHPLLKGVFDPGRKLRWWLEIIAFPMKVVDPIRAVALVDSLEMLTRYNASTMAAVFEFGHGKVEQCVSHFFLQEEGLASLSTVKDLKIFAADSLGISLDQIRQLDAKHFFDGGANTEALTKEIAEDYSMFKLIVNFVVEKRKQVEQR